MAIQTTPTERLMITHLIHIIKIASYGAGACEFIKEFDKKKEFEKARDEADAELKKMLGLIQ